MTVNRQNRRRRGRPVGTGPHVKEDAHALVLITELLTNGVAASVTAAIRQLEVSGSVSGSSLQATIRRLQRKWKEHAAGELAATGSPEKPEPSLNYCRYPEVPGHAILVPPEDKELKPQGVSLKGSNASFLARFLESP